MKNNYLLTISFLLFIIFQTYAQQDSDWDGMPDDWEIEFGLDPNDKKDAYHDTDGDHVINIYEYQMESDPTDNTKPNYVVFDNTTSLESFLSSVPSNHIVRIPEGEYKGDIILNRSEEFKLMIQGGWSIDLKDYNPQKHKTIISGNDNYYGLVYIGTPNEQSITLDGLHIENCNHTLGALSFSSNNPNDLTVNISNCTIRENDNIAGISFGLEGGGKQDIRIFNNTIFNNKFYGVFVHITEDVFAQLYISNNTIVGNGKGGIFGEGVRIKADEESFVSIELKNNIIFNNINNKDFKSEGNCEGEGDTNIIGGVELIDNSEIDFENIIDIIPDFEDESISDFRPLIDGNLIDAGIDIGLIYTGGAPDLGGIELGLFPNSINEVFANEIILYPNPASTTFHIDSEIDITKLSVFDLTGKEIFTTMNTDIDMKSWIPGLYQVKVHTNKGISYKKIIKL